jgi:putative ABC transport system permease protein
METFQSHPCSIKMKKQLIHPPILADRLLRWYCGNASIEDLQGDAEEIFHSNVLHMPLWKAQLNYWIAVLSLIFSYSVASRRRMANKNHFETGLFQPALIRNYFVISSRTLLKHRFFAIINISGLAIGMSISLLLIAMLTFLWTYDDFHFNKDNIYRVITTQTDKIGKYQFASAPHILADKLKHEYTGIDEVVRINSGLGTNINFADKKIPIHGYFVDANFLDVFTFPLLKGNSRSVFDKKNNIVLTEKSAHKIFGDEDPIGKVVELDGIGIVEVSGVLKDIPRNSHMHFDVLASYEFWLELHNRNVKSTDSPSFLNSYVYLQLESGDISQIEGYLNQLPKALYLDDEQASAKFELQALLKIAPGRELYNQIGPEWGYASLSIFMILTVLILLPACFNYANISISRALKRMKEIGLRKAMGSQRQQIFFQFITETVLISVIALAFSFYIFILIRGEFLSMVIGSEMLDLSVNLRMMSMFMVFGLLVGLIAGLVPAMYFSKLSPIQALKGKIISPKASSFNLRKALIVSQFALSLGFIMGVVVILNQYRHSLNHDFGFDQQNIVDVELQGVNPQNLKNEFSKVHSVEVISMSSSILGTSSSEKVIVKTETDSVEVTQMFVDQQFLSNMDLKLLAGNNFPDDSLSKRFVIVNEEFLKTFKLNSPREAINQSFALADGNEVVVAGVVRNFHYADLRSPIGSFFFRYDPREFRFANIKTSTADLHKVIAELEPAWKNISNDKKLKAAFLADSIRHAYSFYFSMVKVCGFLGLLAISISCLGLLGMVVFTVENRMKEVGVRKVMGASTINITMVLSRDFIKLMAIAALIATPLGYVFFERLYLRTQQYYYQSVGLFEISISLFVMVLIGLVTILSQTYKAANKNPVDTLRSE